MDQLQLDIQKEQFEIQKQREIKQQKLKEILLKTLQEQRNSLELTNREQISENKHGLWYNTLFYIFSGLRYEYRLLF